MYGAVQSYTKEKIMKKIIRVLLSLSLILGASIMTCNPVQAHELAVDGTVLTQELESTMEVLAMTRGIYLLSGSASITSPGVGQVCSTGKTYATQSIPSMYVAVYIQRYNGSTWSTVANWTQYAYNTNIVTSSKTYSVSRGYYYRTYTVHNAYGETGSGCTNGIYIS